MQGQRKPPREAKQELRPRLSRRSLQGEDTVAPPRGLDGRWGTVWLKSAFGWIFLTVIPSANGSGLQGQNLMLQIFLNQNHLQGPILSGRGGGDDPWDTSQAPSLSGRCLTLDEQRGVIIKCNGMCHQDALAWDFLDSPVVKTPSFQGRGHRFHPWSGNKIPHAVWHYQKKKMMHQLIYLVQPTAPWSLWSFVVPFCQ